MTTLPLISPEALDRAAHLAFWRGFWSPGGLELTHSVAAAMALPAGSRVLDAGAGSGESAVYLAEAFGWQMTALDADPFGLALARDKAKHPGLQLETAQADLFALPFDDGYFGGVFSQGTFEMLGDRRPLAAQEWARVLRPGGVLGLGSAILAWPGRSTHTPTLTTLEQTRAALEAAGLNVTLAEPHPHGERLWAEFHAPHRDAAGRVRRPGMEASLEALERERDLLGVGVVVALQPGDYPPLSSGRYSKCMVSR
ncbi:MAG: class I SAM-dependent methyltransferase [Deinococcus sp.]